MNEEKTKKSSVAKKILLIFAIIIFVAIFVIFGGYLYLKYVLKIDVLAIKNGIELLNKPFNESAIVDNGFDDEDSSLTFYKLYQNENIYKESGDEYVFDNDEFESCHVESETILTDKELASVISVFLKNIENDNLGDIGKDVNLKQISFLSFVSGEESTLRVKYIVEVNLSSIKNSAGESLLSTLSLTDYIPQKIYLTCEQDIFIDLFYEKFSSSECDILINGLNSDETGSVLNIVSMLFGDDVEIIKQGISTIFPGILFGNDEGEGLMQKIFGEGKFSFVNNDGVKLRIIP